MKKIFNWLLLTKIGRFIGSFGLFILLYVVAEKTEGVIGDMTNGLLFYTSYVFGVLFVSQFVVWLIYSIIINPFRDYCEYSGRNKKICKFLCKKNGI